MYMGEASGLKQPLSSEWGKHPEVKEVSCDGRSAIRSTSPPTLTQVPFDSSKTRIASRHQSLCTGILKAIVHEFFRSLLVLASRRASWRDC